MKLLLDTHAFLYWDLQKELLSDKALALLEDPKNNLFLSMASVWEIQIKVQIGKLKLNPTLSQTIADHEKSSQLTILPIHSQHIYNLSQLPFHHKDPFDRMLISQAMTEGLSLLSKDAQITKYQVNVIW
jgi:PIN domain nuclease of toxin-antitoxin system